MAGTVRVEVTYDMGKQLGAHVLEIDAETVDDVVRETRERFEDAAEYDRLTARAALAINGVLLRHRDRRGKRLAPGDRVTFVKAAAGG